MRILRSHLTFFLHTALFFVFRIILSFKILINEKCALQFLTVKLFLINNYISKFSLINFFAHFSERRLFDFVLLIRQHVPIHLSVYRSTYLSVYSFLPFFHLPFLSLSLSPLHHSKAARPLAIRCVLRSCGGSSLIITKILMAPANGFS